MPPSIFARSRTTGIFGSQRRFPGPTTARLGEVARELDVVIIAPLFEKRAPGLYHNTAAIMDADGTYVGISENAYSGRPAFLRKILFRSGGPRLQILENQVRDYRRINLLGSMVPEGARLTALSGAEILFYPTAIGWLPSEKQEYGKRQHSSWETIQRGHAIANGCYVAVPNRTGLEAWAGGDGIEFWGQSFVADPSGEIVAKARVDEEEVLVVEIDLTLLDQQRTHWPFLRDRRIDAYAEISKRYID